LGSLLPVGLITIAGVQLTARGARVKGSVYKRCNRCGRNVKQRSCPKCRTTATSWAFRIYVGKGADGRWIERRKAGFETKRDAERALTEIAASVAQGMYVQPSAVTVSDYLRDEWLPATAPPRVRHETWQDRRNNLERHVISRIGEIKLQDLTAAHLNRVYGELLTDGRADGDGGLSPTSVHRVHGILRKALNDAVRWGLLERNVATLADPPTMRTIRASRRRTMRTWSNTELRTFLKHTRGHSRHAIWLVTAFCGLRRSEVLGLRWHDIDLDARVLTVRATVVPGANGYELTEEQKSDDSSRTIHLDKITVATLRRQHHAVATAAAAAGPAWQDCALVFPRAGGIWENPPAVSLAFHRAVSAADVPAIRLHDLRHTHASLLLKSGVNPKVVSERLGHSSVAFTLDTYAHVMPGMQPEAAEAFSDLVFNDEDRADDD
jgi:integrase